MNVRVIGEEDVGEGVEIGQVEGEQIKTWKEPKEKNEEMRKRNENQKNPKTSKNKTEPKDLNC